MLLLQTLQYIPTVDKRRLAQHILTVNIIYEIRG